MKMLSKGLLAIFDLNVKQVFNNSTALTEDTGGNYIQFCQAGVFAFGNGMNFPKDS